MQNALWITLVGMGMVFLVILFLWGLMALLVRLTAEVPVEQPEQPPTEPPAARELDRKRGAAAVAVATALALRQPAATPNRPVPLETVSSWLTVHRAGLFAQRARPPRRR